MGCTLLTDDPLKQGYWFSPSRGLPGSRGYYVNELAQYCVLDSWEQCVAAGTLCTDPDKSHNTSWFPPTMTNAGECKLPAGYFFNNGTGYYANPAGHYCAFTSWNQWLAAGGPRSGARTFPKIPTSMSYDGICGATSSGSSSGTPYNPNQGACPDGYVDCNLSAWPGSGCQPGTALDYNTCF